MKKNNKIRSKVVRESLLDYNNLANTLKENTTAAVKDLLSEAVRDTYSKILAEDDDKDYDVEEVEDTDSANGTDADVTGDTADTADNLDAEGSDDVDVDDVSSDDDADDVESHEGIDDNGDLTGETSASGEDEDGAEWSEFDKYKISDNEYDLSNAKDDEIVKVYKLLKNDDQVIVNKSDDNKVSIKDNETGDEYLLDLGDEDLDTSLEDGNILDDDEDAPLDFDGEDDDVDIDDDMNESKLYEIALDDKDSRQDYTDNYQSKDALESGQPVADGKDSADWGSKGLRDRGKKKPWSGKLNNFSENQPFSVVDRNTLKEDDIFDDDTDEAVEEGASIGGRRGAIGSGRSIGTKQHTPDVSGNKNPYGQHHVSTAGKYKASGNDDEQGNEVIRRKADKIFKENKELKVALGKFKKVLQEAAVTNVNLGQIIKLISENTTSQDEKKEIIARFGKEAKTVEQSKNLYESISNDLRKKNKMSIDEGNQYNVEGSKQINETQIYQSKDLLDSLDLMHRLCK